MAEKKKWPDKIRFVANIAKVLAFPDGKAHEVDPEHEWQGQTIATRYRYRVTDDESKMWEWSATELAHGLVQRVPFHPGSKLTVCYHDDEKGKYWTVGTDSGLFSSLDKPEPGATEPPKQPDAPPPTLPPQSPHSPPTDRNPTVETFAMARKCLLLSRLAWQAVYGKDKEGSEFSADNVQGMAATLFIQNGAKAEVSARAYAEAEKEFRALMGLSPAPVAEKPQPSPPEKKANPVGIGADVHFVLLQEANDTGIKHRDLYNRMAFLWRQKLGLNPGMPLPQKPGSLDVDWAEFPKECLPDVEKWVKEQPEDGLPF